MGRLLRPVIAPLLFIFLLPSPSQAGSAYFDRLHETGSRLKADYRGFYLDLENHFALASVLAGAGILANTSADREVQEFYSSNLRSGPTDGLSDAFRLPGEALLIVPVVIGARLVVPDGPHAEWADRTLRAYFVGGPLALALQYATGGARPEEGSSEWKPLRNNNGLSGHGFIGAVPFITAARMSGTLHMKTLFYGLSVMPALSRINDNKHYISQALLGWSIALLSAKTVEDASEGSSVDIVPLINGGDFFITMHGRF